MCWTKVLTQSAVLCRAPLGGTHAANAALHAPPASAPFPPSALCTFSKRNCCHATAPHPLQDIGDMWLAMAEGAEAELPWDAHTTLQVIRNRRNTFNW